MPDIASYSNRLAKNFKRLSKWARREDLTCFRLYDRDVPEFPVIVDWYDGHVQLQEYDTGWVQTEGAHEEWLSDIWYATADALGIDEDLVAIKTRARQRGVTQYEKNEAEGEQFVVSERGLKFLVNLDAYLDTGLFLDHRNTRQRVREEAAGKRVLNLFCYTGSFSVYAAAGGAKATTSVDLSNTYLDWTGRNMALNGFEGPQHRRVRGDVLQYLEETLDGGWKYDLIILDPPSFSNSKKMQGVLDVQRDHRWMVESCLDMLHPGGVLYFSNNLRTFKMDDALKPLCQDISEQSVPEDFRNKRIHQCFRFQK
ncbi:23S rRNA (cytosine1962-C5)-methyltransferase [Silvimonas terrae]|uniref:23S rRNA (Cytosine1962-C5)-methyltransferase n=1 Tax=Silvimonas terrae TaxID=300266 RepID=A0A840RFJ7_9NEIS|nr:class I SAM-dependent methyltransferase [Silvimonas terrae]MBB5191354.1 23S rRNA (cytosine1962-C5)-methyltransferase [Silvimonas terrae]